jgi:hypothetical protein
VRRFVMQARRIPGVRRISLVGSLATTKQNPKDADLLIWIDDEADLTALATAGRQLKGKAQSRNSGADIFLASPKGTYLGRICHYRECRPGIRMSCRALHCGGRAYLCDDLDVLKLRPHLIQAPPVDLWPTVVVRTAVPNDIEELILAVKASESTADAVPQALNIDMT